MTKMAQATTKSYCTIPGCSCNAQKQPYLSFHSFPVNDEARRKWVRAIQRDEGQSILIKKGRTYVCSKLFTPEDYIMGMTVCRLKPESIPSLFSWNEYTPTVKTEPVYERYQKRQQLMLVSVELKDIAKMSAELCVSPGFQTTTAGGIKPLHRFINGQPKIIGIIVLVMGSAFFTFTIAIMQDRTDHVVWTTIPPGFTEGTLFIICGILYILTEHNPTKKTVTVSLALSIVAVLGTFWTLLHITPDFAHSSYHPHYEMLEDNITEIEIMIWSTHYEQMGFCLEGIFVAQCIIGGIIFIVMSVLAGAALRSSNSQAIVIMTAASNDTPAE